MLGVWQGSAAQQARRWCPTACASSRALHTVSAATLADLEHAARRGRAGLRRLARPTSARPRELIERIDGPARVDCGRLEMSRIDRVADRAADRRSTSRYKTHAGIRLTGLPDALVGVSAPAGRRASPAAPAARSSRAGCSTSPATSARRDRQHRRRHRDLRRATSPPTPTSSPSGSPTASTSAAGGSRGDTFAVMDGLRELGARRLVQPRRPRPRLVPASARGGSPTGATPTAALARAGPRRSASRARVLPMSDEPVRTRVARRAAAGAASRSS